MSFASRQDLERSNEAGTDTNRAEVATIGRQHSIDIATLGKGGNPAVDQSKIQFFELGVEYEGARGGQNRLIFRNVRFAIRRAGECLEESTGVGEGGATQSPRSRNSSDSSTWARKPSL
jgi:hypothetical protein